MGVKVTPVLVTSSSSKKLLMLLEDLRLRGFEFTDQGALSLIGAVNAFTILGADADTAKEIQKIVNFVPDYHI